MGTKSCLFRARVLYILSMGLGKEGGNAAIFPQSPQAVIIVDGRRFLLESSVDSTSPDKV
jgi:hypothetical protein